MATVVGHGQRIAPSPAQVSVTWSTEALDDLDAIRAYFINKVKNPLAAQNVARAILAAADSLDTLPRRGEQLADGTHEVPVLKYPQYRLVYDIAVPAEDGAEQVEILSVQTQRTETPRRPTRS